jgi:hypothetical protein
MLEITTGAVRNRLSRGTLPSTKEDGTVYVLLPADMSQDTERDAGDTPHGMSRPEPYALTSEMVAELRDEVHYLRDQLHRELERRSDEAERYQQIIAALTSANRSLSERLGELEPPTDERESPETVEEAPDRAEDPATMGEAQEPLESFESRGSGTARGSLWRRLFGR